MKNTVEKKTELTPLQKKESISQDYFPVVGIGSSAGGLEALECFFKNLPDDTNMAFVIIQHLDPTRKGILPDLIQHFTTMKVVPVENNLQVMPNVVYVIPSNTSMSISRGILHLEEPIETRGLRLPINYFFNSLALDLKDKSIGVILSGMGSDGSLGLKAIKDNGGLVLVQDPEKAKFDSMPLSAINSVSVDYVAPAEELSLKIVNYFNNKVSINFPLENENHLNKIISMLNSSKGHDFSQYKNNTMFRRIERRMNIHQISKISDYVTHLEENPGELSMLFTDILIGVTNFFRDSKVWEKLSEDILPDIFTKLPNGYIFRLWVTGCSTGEEAYSLAIIFKEVLEKMQSAKKITFQIFATDLDLQSIDKARQGIFPEYALTGIDEDRLNRFFVKTDSGYRIISGN